MAPEDGLTVCNYSIMSTHFFFRGGVMAYNPEENAEFSIYRNIQAFQEFRR
jgi:hypothetical protein